MPETPGHAQDAKLLASCTVPQRVTGSGDKAPGAAPVPTATLTCENASGKATSKAKQEARFAIDASDTHHTPGSAATCKDGWKIDDVSWDCSATAK